MTPFRWIVAALAAFVMLTACDPVDTVVHLPGGQRVEHVDPDLDADYPTRTPLGNLQGSVEHRQAQPNYLVNGVPLDPTPEFDPLYDTFCTYGEIRQSWVCPAHATEQNPGLVDRLNATR